MRRPAAQGRGCFDDLRARQSSRVGPALPARPESPVLRASRPRPRSTSTLLTGPWLLAQRGLPALGVAVVVSVVVAPAVKLAIELTVLFGVLARRPARWLPWLFGCLEKVSPWTMVEVFLLGAFVAYTRLRTLATVDVGPATVALAALMLSMAATDATLDREAVWSDARQKWDTRPTPGPREIFPLPWIPSRQGAPRGTSAVTYADGSRMRAPETDALGAHPRR
jgi:hypothetical protein